MIDKIRQTLTIKYTLIIAFILIAGFLSSYAAYRRNSIHLLRNSLFDYMETEIWEAGEFIRTGDGELGTREINVDITSLHNFTYWLVDKKVVRAETLDEEEVAKRLEERLTEKEYKPGKVYPVNIKYNKKKWYFWVLKQNLTLPSSRQAEVFVIANYTPIRRNTKAYLQVVSVAVMLILVLAYLTGNFFTTRSMKYIEQSYQKQRQFVSDAAHELRTPLTILYSYAELLEYNPRRKEVINDLKDEILQMSEMVDRLLAMARYDNSKVAVHKEEISVNQTAAAVIKSMSGLCPSGTIELRAADGDVKIRADKVMIHQLLSILLDNAVKYTGKEKKIEVAIIKLPSAVKIAVKDNGIGIRQEDISHVFDRFWRAEKSRHQKGLGLGLPLAETIVALHNGKISVVSEPGKGTVFEVVLPLTQK